VRILEEAINSPGFFKTKDREIAFYGGTFTALPRAVMTTLLGTARPYVERGYFSSIRISTRPDSIDGHRIQLLGEYGVKTVELGAQSMDDHVLTLAERGHKASDTIDSLSLLRKHGFIVGIQLMPGLPGEGVTSFSQSVDKIIQLRPDLVRLYPTLVIKGTKLADMFLNNQYVPLSLEAGIQLCQKGCTRLEDAEIPVVRIGLMATPSLTEEGQILAGPWHEAFGFLVRSRIHLARILSSLPRDGKGEKIRIRAPRRDIPLIRGHRNDGLAWIERKTGYKVIAVIPDQDMRSGKIKFDIL
jgi:histone acetyltransferase (RNA polymerase elongator complex component)